MTVVNRKEFADLIGKDPRWVGKLIEDGLPSSGGGRGSPIQIETAEAIQWLIDREVRKQVGESEDDYTPRPDTKDGEELLLTKAKRRKAEVEANKAEDSVIEIEDLAQFLYPIATIFGNELSGLGARLGSEVAGIDDSAKCKFIIDNETVRVRQSTANQLREYVAECRAKSSGYGGRATDEECGAMGEC